MEKVLEYSHTLLKSHLTNNDISCDMTIGNGKDSLFLAKISKFIYGFDIQDTAINNTTDLLTKNNINNYKLFKDSHSNVDLYIKEKIKAFIFNFGYLPKGNKKITTKYRSSLLAIKKAISLLDENGIIVMVIYPGHFNGYIESIFINRFVRKINQKEYNVLRYEYVNQIHKPPYLLAIEKR